MFTAICIFGCLNAIIWTFDAEYQRVPSDKIISALITNKCEGSKRPNNKLVHFHSQIEGSDFEAFCKRVESIFMFSILTQDRGLEHEYLVWVLLGSYS